VWLNTLSDNLISSSGSLFQMPLPITSEIDALAALHRQRRYAVHLIPIGDSAVIFSP
jgi:hypothetical protein